MLNGAKHSPPASADSCPEGGIKGGVTGIYGKMSELYFLDVEQKKNSKNFATAVSGYVRSADSEFTIYFALGGRLIVIQTRFRARSVSKSGDRQERSRIMIRE